MIKEKKKHTLEHRFGGLWNANEDSENGSEVDEKDTDIVRGSLSCFLPGIPTHINVSEEMLR